mgnify:CR=1 FL=1
MKFPDHLELIVPTIKALKEMGGTATPAEITNKVIELENYPEEIQTEPQKGDGYRTKLEYRLAWARTYMKKFLNAVEDKSRGLWSLTADGLKLDISDPKKIIEFVLENKKKDLKIWQKNSKKEDVNNEETIEDDSEDWKNELLEIINTSSPKSFENLSQRVLRESGCIDVKVSGGANDKDAWIFNWYDSAVWGIYSRNIDSTLTVNGFGLPQNSTAFIGAGSLRAYISHETGVMCANGGFLIDGESTTTNQAKGITWSGYDKEATSDRSDSAGIIHTLDQEGLVGGVLRIYSDNDDNDGVVIKGGNSTAAYGTRIVNGLWMRSGGLRPTFGTGENGITWANDPAGGSGDNAHIQWYADGSGEDTRLRILVGNDGADDIRLEAQTVHVQGTFSASTNKGFRIPHVLTGLTTTTDLVHTAIEGPQADLIYRGRAKLVSGISTVNIDTTNNMTDGTFVNLNRDVQCFTSNETGWTAVKGSVTGNLLTIIAQDNTCTDTISWMVVGERWDLAMYDPINPMTAENGKLKTEIPNSSYNKDGDYEQDYIRENKFRVGISTISRPSIENKEVE